MTRENDIYMQRAFHPEINRPFSSFILACQTRKNASETNNINDGSVLLIQSIETACTIPEPDINVISNICVFAAMTSQNVCSKKVHTA